jgi:NAD(P)-dependent dehydrogenase (short-subunit alcohol dehydrogenase family)
MGCRNLEKSDKELDQFLKEFPLTELVQLEVTSTSEIRNLLNHLKSQNQMIDILINNAGVFLESSGPEDQSVSSIFKVDPVIILKTIEANTIGPLKLSQSLIPMMLVKGEGRVINISSEMGQLASMGGHWPGYRLSKTALNSLTCILDAEVGDEGIFVNSVCPGWVRTDMGGKNAYLSVEEGVKTTVWLATTDEPPRRKFLRNMQEVDW